MKLFIDTANVEEIRRAAKLGVISGVTTNPSLIAKEGRDFVEVVREISEIVDGPISAEVVSLDADGMVSEARALCEKIGNPNLVIKIPMCEAGLEATARLAKLGVKTNVTLIFSTAQALLAAAAGASYVSPFVGRLDDVGQDGMELVADIAAVFRASGTATEIIAASIRGPLHVVSAARAGSDIATVPYRVIEAMTRHPLTEAGIARFLADWESMKK